MCQRDLIIAGLLACGLTEVSCRSRKYRQFNGARFSVFVGRSGALRRGLLGCRVSDTLSHTGGLLHRSLVTVGKRATCYSSTAQALADLEQLMGG